MSLRIAFDLDGVLADMTRELNRCASVLFGTDPDLAVDLSASQERQLWQHVETTENFWEGLEELEEGAIRSLAATAGDRRWEVIFLTTRPSTAGSTVQVQSQRWLQSKGFSLPSVYVVYGSRGKVAAALDLDVLVDDRLDNCLDVIADSKARPVLFVSGQPKEAPLPAGAQRLGIEIAQTMAECLESLAKLESSAADKSSLIARMMRTLGLRSASK